ncbi:MULTISPECIES: FecCD family ABC transporter permease [Anoxybacillaceae]|uniref:Iron ABC transporter permease n=1 Tax=Anoxybacteroides rupiense TaxID=311460 RepID=A0ABD5IUQ2_9BACL|nr:MULTISPECIES: iron ABC transporter permease [Anoxybacillus]MBB3906681.1 iron complex transport system permease protein [Anoxybacillus rupiensis]MED5052053.1 iron ABC transporter permease [Anoxybacillus rupiensis]QHC04610.1 iron chelate uptake ABC transporter family permease subunit [Anoxybacillus sp. PDR2]
MPKSFIRKSLNNIIAYVIALTAVVVCMLLGISIGSLSIPFSSIIDIFLEQWWGIAPSPDIPDTLVQIVMAIRLPRVVLAFLVGASLSLAGAAFQGLLKNPLADPYTLGVSSGASVGAVVVLFFHLQLPWFGSFTLPIMSIAFGLLTLFLVLFFTRAVDPRMSVETIILTGIIFSAFFSALISLMIALTGEELRQIITWLMGSVAMRSWKYVVMMLPFFIIGCLLLLVNHRELNAFAFGEEAAAHIGVHVAKRKLVILIGASLLTGAAVAVSGAIGFVGLVVPHMIRLVAGPNHRLLLPLSLLYGGAFLVLADLAARTMISPSELPIGIITSLIGAPLFAGLFLNRMKRKT